MEESLVKNAADASQVKAGKRAEKFRVSVERKDLFWLLSNRTGRKIYWKWLSKCGTFKTSFGDGNDKTNFREGKRNIGLMMLAELQEVHPGSYMQMVNEAKEDELKFSSLNQKRKVKENE